MAYDEKLAARIRANSKGRKSLKGKKTLEEKRMFGGLTLMLNYTMAWLRHHDRYESG